MTRKIIQITTAGEAPGSFISIFALCNDGTLWSRPVMNMSAHPWEEILTVPQDDSKFVKQYLQD